MRTSASGSPSTTIRSATAPAVTVPRSEDRPSAVADPDVAARSTPSSADEAAVDHPHELDRVIARWAAVVPHRERDPRVPGGRQRRVGLLALALGLLDQGAREVVGEALGEIVERAQRGHEH